MFHKNYITTDYNATNTSILVLTRYKFCQSNSIDGITDFIKLLVGHVVIYSTVLEICWPMWGWQVD